MSVVISPSIVTNIAPLPLTHARIGYDNFVVRSTVTASSETEGRPGDAIKTEATAERWQPATMPASVTIDSGSVSSGQGSYLGIAAHTLGSNESTVYLEGSSDNSEWEPIESFAPANDRTIMLIFPEFQYRYWRLRVEGATAPQIGVVYIGQILAMQRPIYGGHSPLNLSRKTTIRPNKTEGGQWLGRSVIRNGLATSYKWEHLTAGWYRENFDPFVEAARYKPFFLAWRPETFPEEVGYCWTSGDIQPSNSGTRDLMSVSISVEAYADR